MRIASLLVIALAAFVVPEATAGWISCAKEDGFCKFEGRREVGYGAGKRWVTRFHTNGVKCSSDRFGGDPAPGVPKSCQVKEEVVVPSPGPAQWTRCAAEDAFCAFSGRREVAYGARDRWVKRVFVNGVKCANDRFGVDPIPGVAKTCSVSSVQIADNAPVDASWRRCAGEGEACRFSGSRRIAYGAQGRYAYRDATNAISCSHKVFGDPAPGVHKACFVQP